MLRYPYTHSKTLENRGCNSPQVDKQDCLELAVKLRLLEIAMATNENALWWRWQWSRVFWSLVEVENEEGVD